MIILSKIFGGIAGLTGTLISITESNLPTGPVIVLVISLIVVFSILFSPKRGILSRILINSKKRKMFRKQLENKKIQLSKMKGGMKS